MERKGDEQNRGSPDAAKRQGHRCIQDELGTGGSTIHNERARARRRKQERERATWRERQRERKSERERDTGRE